VLLTSAWCRLLVAAGVIAGLWAAVLWVAPTAPSISPAQAPAEVAPAEVASRLIARSVPAESPLHAVVRSGAPAPVGGRFDRFEIPGEPVVAPVNARGQVAFYATVLRSAAREGIFIADSGRVRTVAAFGDAVPGGGTLAGFEHPLPVLNAAGHVAFVAQIAGGRATEGMFLASEEGVQAIALAGDDAPGLPSGVLVGFDAPALNDNDELAFVASVRRGRDLLDVLYFWNGQRLQRVVAETERLIRVGGTMDKIGSPALNNSGVIAFPATILKGPVLGGIFVAGARELGLLVAAGERLPQGMILRFSEHLAIDDADAIVFGAYVGDDRNGREAVLRTGSEGLAEVALEGDVAPGGGRYAGFGPWPTAAPDGSTAFIAALDGGPGPLAAFSGGSDAVQRIAVMGQTLPQGGRIGRFALNAVAAAGPGGRLTVATTAQQEGEANAIYCQCPAAAE
jgi:hypothetical protein